MIPITLLTIAALVLIKPEADTVKSCNDVAMLLAFAALFAILWDITFFILLA